MTDASRLRVVGGAAVLAGALAAGAFYGMRERAVPLPPSAIPGASTPSIAEAPRRDVLPPDRPASPAPDGRQAATIQAPAQQDARPARAPEPPRFDVVRMGARGTVVVAGRAAPGAEVLLLEGGREIGRARADSRGEWVILPADPLGAGARELSLRARLPGGDEMTGPDTVLVVGPAPTEGQVAAAQPREVPAASRPAGTRAGSAPGEEIRVAETSPRAAEARTAGATPGNDAGADPGNPAGSPTTKAAAGATPAAAEQPLVLLLPPTAQAAPRPLSAPAGKGAEAALGLDVVDYDDSNTMRFAGTAPPGAQLRVYADNRHLGDATADPAGRWSLTPAEAPELGRHTLRVDQLGTGAAGGTGPLAGRIEVAFQRESLPPGLIRDGRVVVQPGHNLWRIARDAYGRGMRYTVIFRANQAQIRNPARIYPGQVFAVPEAR
ncbi:LysM peptidoglycan-binding domain-containing protein [Pararoseomonas indoligenes]|uniref:LysM peptidoglycan-binding domain-containing protein n=1 Tax=Roseomonas indoligenes TaxID=2820811 RepID=A0A940MZJ4_9PROT|nr:LysM peptidoglycan-binding domain-containing protein [Pararoseomonas indoligenes]MBP0494513.1 LysM peptidoglycan-binding domain-containing protein [Pararoseomonas indoligenes]